MVDPVPVAIIGVLIVAALTGMALSWRLRHRRQADLALPVPGLPAGAPTAEADGLYLATTFAGRPLDRVVAAGLGFRAQAHLAAGPGGITVERIGADPILLPPESIDGVGIGTWTIDRTVEPRGLTIVAWSMRRGDERVRVESAFRLEPAPRADLIAAIRALVAAHETSGASDV